MHKATALTLAIAFGAASLSAQTIVVPPGADVAEQASLTSNPFSASAISGAGVANRTQYVYDASNLTTLGVSGPVLITRLRFRANGVAATWTGATISNMVIDMSTSPADYLAMVATFNQNHGQDRISVWNSAVTIQPGTSTAGVPGPFVVDLDLVAGGVPFAYNPALGDLVMDFQSAGISGTVTGAAPNMDALATGALARRSLNNNGQFIASGTTPSANAMVVEITYVPIGGIYGNFSATPIRGGSPLLVNFTDLSSSSVGINSWAWDFENDGIDDAFTATTSHTYPCGTHNVRLTVGDGVNPPVSIVRPAFIVTDEVVASFTWTSTAAGSVSFTDTTTPAATSWAWDFDDNGSIDSTLPNPVWNVGDCLPHNVRLTTSRLCGPGNSVTQRVVGALQLETTYAGGSGGASNWCSMFDLNVLNPNGIEICGLDLRTNVGVGTAFNVDIYVTPGTCVGNERINTPWRRVAQAAAVSGGNSSPSQVRSYVGLPSGIYLAPGSYGFMIHHVSGAGQTYSGSTVLGQYGNADLAFDNSRVEAGLFSPTASLFVPRIWNGTIYYATCNTSNEASYGFFGLGCPGSLGVPGNVGGNPPKIGTTMTATLTNLPVDSAIMIIGFSNTVSPLGPLPIDLSILGLSGCFGRISADANAFLLGSGNQATYSLTLPNNPRFLCSLLYTQALVFDPGINSANSVMSDAAAFIIGQ